MICAPARCSGRRSCCRCSSATRKADSPTFEEFQAYLDEEGRAVVTNAHAEAIRTGETQEIEYEVRLPSGTESRHQGVVIPTFDAQRQGGAAARHRPEYQRAQAARSAADPRRPSLSRRSDERDGGDARPRAQPAVDRRVQLSGRQPAAADLGGAIRVRRGRAGHDRRRAAGPSRRQHHPPGPRDGRQPAQGGRRRLAAAHRRRHPRLACRGERLSQGRDQEGAGRRRPQRAGRPDPDPAGDGQPLAQCPATPPPTRQRPRS